MPKTETTRGKSGLSLPLGHLRKEFGRRRAKNPRYSLRAYARSLDISSGALAELFGGKRELGLRTAERLVRKLALPEADRRDWEGALTRHRHRLRRQRRLAPLAKEHPGEYTELSADILQAISEWHHIAILNLLETLPRKDSAAWMAGRLGLSEKKVTSALARLHRLGLTQRGAEGWERTHAKLTTSREVPSAAIQRFHEGTLRLAIRSLRQDAVADREISSVTLPLSPRRIPEAKAIIQNFRRSLADLLEDDDASEVFQLTVALFPLTRPGGKTP